MTTAFPPYYHATPSIRQFKRTGEDMVLLLRGQHAPTPPYQLRFVGEKFEHSVSGMRVIVYARSVPRHGQWNEETAEQPGSAFRLFTAELVKEKWEVAHAFGEAEDFTAIYDYQVQLRVPAAMMIGDEIRDLLWNAMVHLESTDFVLHHAQVDIDHYRDVDDVERRRILRIVTDCHNLPERVALQACVDHGIEVSDGDSDDKSMLLELLFNGLMRRASKGNLKVEPSKVVESAVQQSYGDLVVRLSETMDDELESEVSELDIGELIGVAQTVGLNVPRTVSKKQLRRMLVDHFTSPRH